MHSLPTPSSYMREREIERALVPPHKSRSTVWQHKNLLTITTITKLILGTFIWQDEEEYNCYQPAGPNACQDLHLGQLSTQSPFELDSYRYPIQLNQEKHLAESYTTPMLKINNKKLTRKWTSNHPPKPHNLAFSSVMDDEMLARTSRISSTVTVKQSISLMITGVPIIWFGWRLFQSDV